MTRIKTIPAQKMKKKSPTLQLQLQLVPVAQSVFPPCFRPFQMRLIRRAAFLYQYEIRGRSFFAASADPTVIRHKPAREGAAGICPQVG